MYVQISSAHQRVRPPSAQQPVLQTSSKKTFHTHVKETVPLCHTSTQLQRTLRSDCVDTNNFSLGQHLSEHAANRAARCKQSCTLQTELHAADRAAHCRQLHAADRAARCIQSCTLQTELRAADSCTLQTELHAADRAARCRQSCTLQTELHAADRAARCRQSCTLQTELHVDKQSSDRAEHQVTDLLCYCEKCRNTF